jgi:hypothetical protein
LPKLFCSSFSILKKEGSNIWGISATPNPFYMKPGYSTNLKYLIGNFFGIINTKNPAYKLKFGDNQEDKERTLRYFLEDKKIVRLNDVSVKTTMYAPGGMMTETRKKETKQGTELLVQTFPEYVTQIYKPSQGIYDIRFKTGKIAQGE